MGLLLLWRCSLIIHRYVCICVYVCINRYMYIYVRVLLLCVCIGVYMYIYDEALATRAVLVDNSQV